MTTLDRFKKIRQELGLSQAKFAKAISVSSGYVAGIELGNRAINDRIIKLVCNEFGVSEEWLRTGKGEMFVQTDSSKLNELIAEYRLDGIDAKILEAYVTMSDDSRAAVKDFICNIATAISESDGQAHSIDDYVARTPTPAQTSAPIQPAEMTDEEIEAEVEAYRQDLKAQRRAAASSSVSDAINS